MLKLRKVCIHIFVYGFSFMCFVVLSCTLLSFIVSATSDMGYNSDYIYTIETNCDNPSSIAALIDRLELTAIDNSGIELDVSKINVYDAKDYYDNVLNQPNGASRRLGLYNIKFRCYDAYGNYGDFLLKVNVVDSTPPTIDNQNSKLVYTFKRKEINENTYLMIINGIVAADNHDYVLTKEFEDTDIDLTSSFGLNHYNVVISDTSGNETIVNLEIEVIDDIGPKVEAIRTYLRLQATTTPLSDSALIEDYFKIEAMDEEDNQMIDIEVMSNEYSANCNKVGLYLFRVRAKDSENNATIVNCYIEVYNNNPPAFYLSSTEVTVTQNVRFSLEDAEKIIRARKLAKNDNFVLSVEEDEYSECYNEVGSYKYVLKATYEDESYSLIEFLINAVEASNDNEIIQDNENGVGFFGKSWNFLKKTGSFLYKIIKWPVDKIINLIIKLFKK